MGQARTVLDRVTDAVFGGDRTAAEKLYATDAIGVTPEGQELKGGHEIVAFMDSFFKAFPDASFEPITKIEAGKVAVDEGKIVGTNTGPLAMPGLPELPATGKRVSLRACDICEVDKGLIKSHHFYFDQGDMLNQLGLLKQDAEKKR